MSEYTIQTVIYLATLALWVFLMACLMWLRKQPYKEDRPRKEDA